MTLTATARHSGATAPDLLQKVQGYLEVYSMPVIAGADRVTLKMPKGQTTLRLLPDGFALEVEAEDEVARYHLCEGAVYMVEQVCPDAAEGLGWDSVARDARSDLPPGMYPARFAGLERVGANFLRVTLDCAGTARMMTGGMHFSVLLPPAGRAPVWPALNDKGRTVWPKGEEKLHRAAFTFIARDPAAGRFSFDIYAHDGSPTTDWALAARAGDPLVISGPGGGDLPRAERFLIAGDETALPAIRDILARSPHARGLALVETGEAADRLLEKVPEGIELRWIDRAAGGLWPALAAEEIGSDCFVWIAARAPLVRQARERFSAQPGFDRTRAYFASYWS